MQQDCYFDECENEAAVRGLCRKHYMQAYRGTLGSSRKIALPGEGDQITVRVPMKTKNHIARLARARGVEPSVLYRKAIEDFLANLK